MAFSVKHQKIHSSVTESAADMLCCCNAGRTFSSLLCSGLASKALWPTKTGTDGFGSRSRLDSSQQMQSAIQEPKQSSHFCLNAPHVSTAGMPQPFLPIKRLTLSKNASYWRGTSYHGTGEIHRFSNKSSTHRRCEVRRQNIL